MRNNFKFILVICCFLVLSITVFPQTPQTIEQELVAAIKELQTYSTYGSNYDEDKLAKANENFLKKMLEQTKVPSTLSHKFNVLKEHLHIATSEDGKFRLYSWDTEDGGTMHEFTRVYQYQGADGKVYSKTDEETEDEGEGGGGSFVTDVFTVDASDGKFYIVCSTFIGSTNDHYQSADLYKIEGANLFDKVKLIKTKSGLTNTLGFEYNFFSVFQRKERPIRLISYDKKTKTLKIPVVIEDKEFPNGRVTNKFISYTFDGTYFVKAD